VSKLSQAVEKLTSIADAHEKLLEEHEKRIKAIEDNPVIKKKTP
jgi:hypothetical protein